jgi:hypothetical protein
VVDFAAESKSLAAAAGLLKEWNMYAQWQVD